MDFNETYYYWSLWRDLEQRRKRKERDWTKELLRDVPVEAGNDTGDLLSKYLDGMLREARQAMRQVEREIYARTNLHDEAVAQLDYQIGEATASLERFHGWGVGYNRGVDQKRLSLEHQLSSLRHERRASRLRFWEDAVRLRGELHARQQAYEAALRRSRLKG